MSERLPLSRPAAVPDAFRHGRDILQRGFYDSSGFLKLREAAFQKWGEPEQARLGLFYIRHRKVQAFLRFCERNTVGIDPEGLPLRYHPGDDIRCFLHCCIRHCLWLRIRRFLCGNGVIRGALQAEYLIREAVERFLLCQRLRMDPAIPDHFFPLVSQRLPFRDALPVGISGFEKADIAFIDNFRGLSTFLQGNSGE